MCLLFLVTLVDIKDKCKMCGSSDDGMNNSTCNWVNYTSKILYCMISLLLQVQCDDCSCWVHVTCTDLEYSELSASTKFTCIECTKLLSINNNMNILHTTLYSAIDINNGVTVIVVERHCFNKALLQKVASYYFRFSRRQTAYRRKILFELSRLGVEQIFQGRNKIFRKICSGYQNFQ